MSCIHIGGTGGTEISYIVRSLLHRLGLAPNSKQLRIICTSASLEGVSSSGGSDPKFLREFFGTNEKEKQFEVINGPTESYVTVDLDSFAEFTPFFRSLEESPTEECLDQLFNALCESFKIESSDYGEILNQIKIESALHQISKIKKVEDNSEELNIYPISQSDVAKFLFAGDEVAAKGFFRVVGSEDESLKKYFGKLGLHLFVKNLDGIRRSMGIQENSLVAPILYDNATQVCRKTGAIALDAMFCQDCGELYYKGFLYEKKSRLFVTNDSAISENIEEQKNVLIHFPTNGRSYEYKDWRTDYYFNGFIGEITSNPKFLTSSWAGISFMPLEYDKNERRSILPCICVHCEANWSTKSRVKSPIRIMGTGYNKFSQILIEQMMNSLSHSHPKGNVNEKLVVFSDSRKDASLIAADLELNHYRDTVRALLEDHLESFGEKDEDLSDFIEKVKAGTLGFINKHSYAKKNLEDAQIIKSYLKKELNDKEDERFVQKAKNLIRQISSETVPFSIGEKNLVNLVLNDFRSLGMNPAGLHHDRDMSWFDAFSGDDSDENLELGHEKKKCKGFYINKLKSTMRETLTGSLGRDFESLGYGWMTFPRFFGRRKYDEITVKLIDTVLRFLIFHYKTKQIGGGNRGFDNGLLPQYFTNWLTDGDWVKISSMNRREVSDYMLDLMRSVEIINDTFEVNLDRLYVHKAGETFWECSKCRSIQPF